MAVQGHDKINVKEIKFSYAINFNAIRQKVDKLIKRKSKYHLTLGWLESG